MAERDVPAAMMMFADVLRQVRADAGLSQEEMAAKLNFSRSLVGMNESGLQFPSVAYVQRCEEVLGTEGRLIRLHKLAATEARSGRIGALIEAESRATVIRTFHPVLVPGLLQTEAYARAVIGGGAFARKDHDLLEEGVATRMRRQEILDGDSPVQLWVVLGEAVLHQIVQDKPTMKGQLNHVLDLIRGRLNIRIQVLPFTEAQHALAEPVTILDVGEDMPVVHLDGPGGGRTTTDERIVTECVNWFDVLRSQAASLSDSARVVESRMEEL